MLIPSRKYVAAALLLAAVTSCATGRGQRDVTDLVEKNPLPSSGPRFTTAAAASAAAGFPIPNCLGANYFNLRDSETIIVHFDRAGMVVQSAAEFARNTDIEMPGVELQRFSIHGVPAIGYQYTGNGSPSPLSSDETVGPPAWSAYLAWNEAGAAIQTVSNISTLEELKTIATSCTFQL